MDIKVNEVTQNREGVTLRAEIS